MTKEEYEKRMKVHWERIPKEIKEKVDKMTEEEARVRYEELQIKIVPMIPLPHMTEPIIAESREYHYLKKRLGYY